MRAIAYDRRGYGRSSGPRARRLGEHVEDAAALLEALGAVPATVVGSSAGGVLALRLAVERPELVSALVLIEPAYQMALVPSPSAGAGMAGTYLRWALFGPERAARHFYRWATRYAAGGTQYDAYPDEWQRIALGHARTALGELARLVPPRPRRSGLGAVSAPTTVVIGDAGQPVFRGTAHLLYTDAPTACAAAIAETVERTG